MAIPRECKRLAEVDFPIAVVSKHAAREKSIRHGHPSTLHLWWARRPLASSRAVLMALLLPDPCDPHCPAEFKSEARRVLLALRARPSRWEGQVKTDEGLRKALLEFIGDFANWDVAADPDYLVCGRGLVKAAHPDETPLVVDPFAGGGSIPLEALRLGCDAFASDLNPVACLILKVMLEDIPKHGPKLAEELRRVGAEIKKEAEKELADLYPKDPDGATPIAYLWARTVRCESPNCGAEIPLVRSFWLAKKANRRRALKPRVVRLHGKPPSVEFEITEPKNEKEVQGGTISRARATCLGCGVVLPPERVRAQLREQRGGSDPMFTERGERIGGARLIAVVSVGGRGDGRQYRAPTDQDYMAIARATATLGQVINLPVGPGPILVPDEPLPFMSGTFNVPLYGMGSWGDLFTIRQKATLVWLARQIKICATHSRAGELEELLAMAFDRVLMYATNGGWWHSTRELVNPIFGRQALPMVWDFCEGVPLGAGPGNFTGAIEWIAEVVAMMQEATPLPGQAQIADARSLPIPDESVATWFSDPPYYFAVPYAELSDFFFVWLRKLLPNHPLMKDPFDASNPLTPKAREITEMAHWDPVRYAGRDSSYFEAGIASAFGEARRLLRDSGIGAVVFAHKTTQGWEAMLSGMIRTGWTITASWPLSTEMGTRLRAQQSAVLASSIHLVCRPRPDGSPVGDWAEVLRELPGRVSEWMGRLQEEGVRGADLVFACIGPALEVFSRYSTVETADGREVGLPEFLVKVWEVVGRAALAQVLGGGNGGVAAVEEDARLTALFLWTLQSTNGSDQAAGQREAEEDVADEEPDEGEEAPRRKPKGLRLIFDVVRRFAQPLGIHLEEWEGRIIDTDKGVVRLLPVGERAEQLFGEDGAQAVADQIEAGSPGQLQLALFPQAGETAPPIRGRRRRGAAVVGDESLRSRREATTLDSVHAAMLLQKSGRANALRALLREEVQRGPEFLRLANALSALYPRESEEKRLLDAMLLAVPR